MKAIFKLTNQNVSGYRKETLGYSFIKEVKSKKDFYNEIKNLEDSDFFEQEDGKVTDCGGNEVFDPAYPLSFDFQDYSYIFVDTESLNADEYEADAAKIKAIQIDK